MKTKRKKSFKITNLKHFLPYILSGIAILAIVFVGSNNKSTNSSTTMSMASLASNDFSVSADQLSEFYVVASLSDSLSLNSREVVASNYVTVSVMRETGQSSVDKIEKPTIIDTTNIPRGIISYAVKEGESMESIAASHSLSTDQIRWSNGKKTTDLSPGEIILLPNVSGIVYTAKSGEDVNAIAAKTGSSPEKIIAYNDLEKNSAISEGQKLILPDGSLPETERPEYVPPRPVYRPVYSYSYLGNTSERQNIQVLGYNWAGGGQCVGYAIWWREQNGIPIPTNWGNANTWASRASASGYLVDRNPSVGAIFQTSSGYYGHVGIVTGLNGDGSITVEEANYGYQVGRVTRATIPASAVGNFYYIH